MTDFFDLRDDYYEDFRQVFGDGEFALDLANDAARADHQRALAVEERWENFDRDLYDSIERDNAMRSPKRDATREFVGDVAINVGSHIGAHIGVRIIDALWDKLFSKEETTPPMPTEEAPSISEHLDWLKANIDAIRQNQGEMQEILNRLSLPKAA